MSKELLAKLQNCMHHVFNRFRDRNDVCVFDGNHTFRACVGVIRIGRCKWGVSFLDESGFLSGPLLASCS